ncbi:MAG: SpoIIE family protein phosphatase [Bacteroidales bacterium]|nr:SpoIIE family protein phosphatase [Bacteroidales bacterium]
MEWTFGAILDLFNELTAGILVAGLLGVSIHILLYNKRMRLLRRDYKALDFQRNLLQIRTKNIEDSLKYAQRIQKAMFITPREMRRLFPESFIYQRPKDIVSGDFYWARRINGKVLFSVADCTGHGVPGAFMSLLGLEFFRQIVVEREIFRPASILNEMNRYFDLVFGNLEELSLKDGIDLAFCAYDYANHTLEYAGAFNPVYIVRNNEILELKGDRIIVGPDYGVHRGSFTNRSIDLEQDDILYMFSDGYPDQFGGPEGKKFKYRRFRHLLMSIHHLPMEDQHRKLEENINEWMGGHHDQIDDQIVIGIRPASFSSF